MRIIALFPFLLLATMLTVQPCAAAPGSAVADADVTVILTSEMVKLLPPPGLYRVVAMKGDPGILAHQARPRVHKDELIHTSAITIEFGEHIEVKNGLGGGGTSCITTDKAGLPKSRPSIAGYPCKKLSATITDDILTVVDQCANRRFTTTIRKLDNTSWEYTHDFGQPSAIDRKGREAAPDLPASNSPPAQAESALQLPERDAKVASDISRSRATLRSESQAANSAKAPANTLGNIEKLTQREAGKPAPGHIARLRWTRIGDHCGSVQPGSLGPVFQR